MDASKPTIVFTTFWDALEVSQNGGMLHEDKAIRFLSNECVILSVALAKPKLPKLRNVGTLDFFCPTWEILKEYKKNRDWNTYTNKYRKILVQNKDEIAQWVDTLESRVYFLCCWENTVSGANCHRHLLYEALSKSKRTKDSANYIFRHGDKDLLHKEKQLFSLLESIGEDEAEDILDLESTSNVESPLKTLGSLIDIMSLGEGDGMYIAREMGGTDFESITDAILSRRNK